MQPSTVRPTMLGLVGIGLLFAAFFPAMKISFITFLGTIPMEISLRESMNALVNTGHGWAVLFSIAGLLVVIRSVLMYDDQDKDNSRWWLTGGAVLTLLFPFNLLRAMDSVVADVAAESDGMAMADTSLGLGLIIPSITFLAVAGLAWYDSSQATNAQVNTPPVRPLSTPPTPPKVSNFSAVYEPTQSDARPKWMTGSEHR